MSGLRSIKVKLMVGTELLALAAFPVPLPQVGIALAVVSLAFGILFFMFAARYYIAIVAVLVSPGANSGKGKKDNGANEKQGNGANGIKQSPMVSVHIPLYNEKNVVRRILNACSELNYPNCEVVIVDDSTDETVQILREWMLEKWRENLILQKWRGKPRFKVIHRENRKGFKGGALNEALKQTSPDAQYVLVFDADFIPPPDTINKFLDYFNRNGANGDGNGNGSGNNGRYKNGELAAVQGYQWHTLNRSENWLTRGVSCEYSGNYMVDRTFEEVTGVMKMVAGSVYAIRADLIRRYGWSESLTEDWELTLRLYTDGYKVLYTPLIQAPAECPSALGTLIRQRMRWAEGHTFNVKKYFGRILSSPRLSLREKLEFLYFTPYYLQSVLLIVGTLFWFLSDVVLNTKPPFWTAEFGWTLVFTNLLALPLMSATGLFLEKRARSDFSGIFSQVVLIYALAPYQAYAALKGLLESSEGSWIRTFKTGRIAGFLGKLEARKIMKKVLPPRRGGARVAKSTRALSTTATVGVVAFISILFVQGALTAPSGASPPGYYFYDQASPPGYNPFGSTPNGLSFMMHLALPPGETTSVPIGRNQSSGPIFFSDRAASDLALPFGAAVSVHVWINASSPPSVGNCTLGSLRFRIDIYDPQNNTIRDIDGAEVTQVFYLQAGVHLYQASWGHIAQNKMLLKGETIVVTMWSPDFKTPPQLLFNSAFYPSNIDFPIVVPENILAAAGAASLVGVFAYIYLDRRRGAVESTSELRGYRDIQKVLIVAAAVIFLTLPLVTTFNEFLTSIVSYSGLASAVATLVPYETAGVSAVLRGVGLQASSAGGQVWISGNFLPVIANIDWNCSGWQSFLFFGVTSIAGLRQVPRRRAQVLLIVVGVLGTFSVNVLRISAVVSLAYFVGYPAALLFHDYAGTILTLAWLMAFWAISLRRFAK